MTYSAQIQFATSSTDIPSESDIDDWIRETLHHLNCKESELTIRIVDEPEIVHLNATYRKQNKSTDVLAFPVNLPDAINSYLLGDVVVCADVINKAATEIGALPNAHWARIIAHGILHLCGHSHNETADTLNMEAVEAEILHRLGFDHPDFSNSQYHGTT